MKKLDQLAEFEEFCHEILPALRADLVDDTLSAEDIARKYEKLGEARRITMIATSENESAVISAIKDLRDRVSGKPTETRDVTHKFDHLSDKELDSALEGAHLELQELTGGKTDTDS